MSVKTPDVGGKGRQRPRRKLSVTIAILRESPWLSVRPFHPEGVFQLSSSYDISEHRIFRSLSGLIFWHLSYFLTSLGPT